MNNNVDSLYLIFSKCQYKSNKQLLEKICGSVDSVIIKGEPLSLLAYGKYGKRHCNDIDILISKANLQKVERLLLDNGYSSATSLRADRVLMLSYSHQVSPWKKPMPPFGSSIIDLNHDLFWGEYTGKRIDIEQFLSGTIEMNIYGVKVRTLPPLKAMIQLILHHYKEMNSIYHLAVHDSINYNMFKDVYYLWKNNKKIIILERLYSLCYEYEIIPYAFYVLYFTNSIFKDEELQRYVDTFWTAEGDCYLNYYGLTEKERKPWKVDFQTRLETDNLYELIKNDLTEEDIKKLERNQRIFG